MNDDFSFKLKRLIKDVGIAVLMVWAVSIGILHSSAMWDDFNARNDRRMLDSLAFEDIYPYYGIYPSRLNSEGYANHGSQAWFKSDSEVTELVESIRGGVRVQWEEEIYCDHNPYDGVAAFEFYAEVRTTGARILQARKREPIADKNGFPMRERSYGSSTNETPIIRYPDHDADCKMVSKMVMYIGSGENQITKGFRKDSEIVHVRGVKP